MKLCFRFILAVAFLCLIFAKPWRRGSVNRDNGHRRDVDAKTGFGRHEQERPPSKGWRSFVADQGVPQPPQSKRLTARDVELSVESVVSSPSGELSVSVVLDSPPAELTIASRWNDAPAEELSSVPDLGSPSSEMSAVSSVTELQDELSPATSAGSGTTPTEAPNACQGLTKPQEGPCLKCRCVSDTAQPKYECTVTECMRGQCVDGHTPPGECCPVCPNGRNCDANGQVIPFGPVVELDNGDQCYCANVQGRWGELEAVCQTPPTPPDYPSYD
ncbi:unnamed protein product [Lymnaea stagnalis]|uniref:VWC2L C-terminal domain-containing protein n=1 Tax=Lymnaea stagnalis TaxID=6523 RepID=A0AAV2IDN1_LYMST